MMTTGYSTGFIVGRVSNASTGFFCYARTYTDILDHTTGGWTVSTIALPANAYRSYKLEFGLSSNLVYLYHKLLADSNWALLGSINITSYPNMYVDPIFGNLRPGGLGLDAFGMFQTRKVSYI